MRRFAPIEEIRVQRGGEVVGEGKRRERCSMLWSLEMAFRDRSVRRKHFLIFSFFRFGQPETSWEKVSSSME